MTILQAFRSKDHGRGTSRRRRSLNIEPLERRALLAGELTETNLNRWSGFTSDHQRTVVSYDTSHVKVGARSIHLRTESGFDTGVRYTAPRNAHLNLTGKNFLSYWVYADNRTPLGFQDNQPVLVLNSPGGSYRYTPHHQHMPKQGWVHFFIPLDGSAEWTRTRTGSPRLSDITSFEIHQDTWDSGFDVYYDGLEFVRRDAGPGPAPPSGVKPNAIKPRVLLYVFDPILENRGGLRTHEVYGWGDPVELTHQIVADLRASSHGLVQYRVVDTVIADLHPYYDDGTRLTDESFVEDWEARDFPEGHFDYVRFIRENNLISRVESGNIDEVWVYTSPMGATWEASMAGRGAYWINGPTQDVDSDRVFPIMGWNYERGVAEALHSFGHRAESTMDHSYGNQAPNLDNNWNRFTYQDRYGEGHGGVGNIHFPVNGDSDYDYDNRRLVESNADDWAQYPNLTGASRRINSDEWSPTHVDPERDYMNWWYSHLPHFAGKGPDGFLNNWWRYLTDVDQFKSGTHGNLGGSAGISEVRVVSPANGARVAGRINIRAEAISDGAIGRVDFYVDGRYLGTDTLAPYTLAWNAGTGRHTITARAYELQHQSESISEAVVINARTDRTPPTLVRAFTEGSGSRVTLVRMELDEALDLVWAARSSSYRLLSRDRSGRYTSVAFTVDVDPSGTVVRLAPTANLINRYGVRLVLRAGRVRDRAGNALVRDIVRDF